MRKFLLASAVGALSGAAMLAVAAGPDVASPEARAYMTYAFGGAKPLASSNFHYGLRLDYSRRAAADVRPPLMQLNFDRYGLAQTRINGLDVVQRLVLKQDEGAVAPEAAAPEAEAPAEGSDTSSDSSSGEDSGSSGETTTQYNVVDWALVAVGAVGIGFVAAEALDADESKDPAPAAAPPPSSGTLGGLLGLLLVSKDAQDLERERWLDGGNGQMGDLIAQ